ncbi:hypothetical protein RHECNPAF_1760058 [Rhizobium etli CNPAF512]|nr:hypothetical protein RHECNPAF_1760058 [Rhizobium etli CNPAF512]
MARCKADLEVQPGAATRPRKSGPIDAVAKEALGIDRIDAELLAQLFAQLRDVAFDDVLFDLFVEDAVDGVEDLGLGHPATAIGDQIFEDAALAPGQREDFAVDLGVAAIREDADAADVGVVGDRLQPAPDRSRPGEDFAWMDRLAHHVVDAAIEKRKRVFQRGLVADRDHRCHRAIPDRPRQLQAALALSDEEGLDGRNIRIGGGLHPVAEFRWIETGRGNALPAKQRCISVFHELALINHYDHSSASESVWHFDDLWVRIARIGDNSLKLMAEINN